MLNSTVIVNTLGEGCGSDCNSPDDCRLFCEYYPESDFCQDDPPIWGFKDGDASSELTLFPNPANGQVKIINLPVDKLYQLTIYSATGQVMQSHYSLSSPVQELETSELVPGFYMLQLSKANGETDQLRFTVAR